MKNESLILLKVGIQINDYCFEEIRKILINNAKSYVVYNDVDHRNIKMKKISENWILIYDSLVQPIGKEYIKNLRKSCNYLSTELEQISYGTFCIGIICDNEDHSNDSSISLFIRQNSICFYYFIESQFPYGVTEKDYVENLNNSIDTKANIDAMFFYKQHLSNANNMKDLIESTSQHQSVEFLKLFLKQFKGLENYDVDNEVIWDKEYCFKFKSYL